MNLQGMQTEKNYTTEKKNYYKITKLMLWESVIDNELYFEFWPVFKKYY